MTYQFDSRLAYARTLPSAYYFDPNVLEQENRNVFGRTWQLAGRADQVREPGQFFTTTIANEPLLVVRGSDGELRALSNVCRHRAGPVAKGEGKRPVLQCGYHGWTYGLDGRLLQTPEMAGIECFDRGDFSLPRFRVEIWNELVFVNLDCDAAPLSDFLGDLVGRLAPRNYGGYRLAARKVNVVFVCSEGDPRLQDLQDAGGRTLKRLCASREVILDIIPRSDHTFSSVDDQERLLKVVCQRISTMPHRVVSQPILAIDTERGISRKLFGPSPVVQAGTNFPQGRDL